MKIGILDANAADLDPEILIQMENFVITIFDMEVDAILKNASPHVHGMIIR